MNISGKEEYLKFAQELAREAGDIMLSYFDTDMNSRKKEDESLVTIADEEINQLVIERVREKYPEHAVFGEEASTKNKSEYLWVCDPIDGTVQFSKGVPLSVFSLALVYDGVPIVGVILDPFTNRLYHAIKEEPAYLNSEEIKTNTNDLSRDSIINVEWWPEANFFLGDISKKLSRGSSCWVLALGVVIQGGIQVARGRYDGCIFAGTKRKSIDIAALKVIVESAGGKVTDIYGNEQRYDGDIKGAIISNGKIHDELVRACTS